jgi:alkylhydroperoxidase/carboxymuconolactone decarboxylase family protein YurZ
VVGLQETLARIALRDDRFISSLPGGEAKSTGLDWSTCALVRLAALIGLDGSSASFVATIHEAESAGASPAEIVATLTAVLPSVGAIRASSAAVKIGLALGYEPDPALEEDTPADLSRKGKHHLPREGRR